MLSRTTGTYSHAGVNVVQVAAAARQTVVLQYLIDLGAETKSRPIGRFSPKKRPTYLQELREADKAKAKKASKKTAAEPSEKKF